MHIGLYCISISAGCQPIIPHGIFPEELKIDAVTPLSKAKDPMMFNNYRPISLISVFAQILERLMYKRLLKFINKYQIFNKHPFGFRD